MNTSRLHDLAKLNILLYVAILSKLTLCAHWPLRSYAVKCLSARMGEVIVTRKLRPHVMGKSLLMKGEGGNVHSDICHVLLL